MLGFGLSQLALRAAVGDPRRLRHILPDHEFRRAAARRPGIFAARHGYRDCLSGWFGRMPR